MWRILCFLHKHRVSSAEIRSAYEKRQGMSEGGNGDFE